MLIATAALDCGYRQPVQRCRGSQCRGRWVDRRSHPPQTVDPLRLKVVLKLPNGKKVKTKVDKSVKAFDSLKVGDVIHVRYTEAIAISVEKP
jgi:hypothetical protein